MKKIVYIQEYSGDTSVPTNGFYTSRMLPRKLNEVIESLNLLIEQAESQEPKALEEKLRKIHTMKECGGRHCRCMNIGNQCSNFHGADCESNQAKTQDEPKEKKLCPMCIEGGSHRLPTDSIMTGTITGTWICFCPCHRKRLNQQ